MSNQEILNQFIHLLKTHSGDLIPTDIKILALRNEDVSILNSVLLEKENVYNIYKTRAYIVKQKEVDNVFGYEGLLLNLEKRDLRKILILGVKIKDQLPMLFFCNEN